MGIPADSHKATDHFAERIGLLCFPLYAGLQADNAALNTIELFQIKQVCVEKLLKAAATLITHYMPI